jgi:uncharacterized protein DUF4386
MAFSLGGPVYRSRFLPRFLGGWLIINGFAYLAMIFTGLLLPQYEAKASNVAFPALLGEMAFMLWLLIMGVSVPKWEERAQVLAGGDKIP